MKYVLLVGVLLLVLSGWAWLRLCACKPLPPSQTGYAKEDWPEAFKLVRDKFPDVRQLTTNELADWLNDKQKTQPLILDARAAKEFAVSHLPNAIHAADEKQALAALNAQPQDAPVVVYCSIGYRSSSLAQKLRVRSYTNVQNLEGSIFMWANEGRPLFRDSQAVNQVHPFDEKWGRLLERSRWAFEAN